MAAIPKRLIPGFMEKRRRFNNMKREKMWEPTPLSELISGIESPFDIDGESDTVSVSSVSDMKYDKWEISGNAFYPTGTQTTIDYLESGYYKIGFDNNRGSYLLTSKEIKTDGLVNLPVTASEQILEHISDFWDIKIIEKHKRYNVLHKTGVLMYGPPGSGKSSLINTMVKNLIEVQKGLVFSIENADDIGLYSSFMEIFRQIEPHRPIIVIIEDCDGLLDGGGSYEKMLLNILDGINQIEHVAYVLTTNYPEKLEARLSNRPGRIDKRFKIGYPNAIARKAFFEFKFIGDDAKEYDLKEMVSKTKGLTISHCKSLFVEHVIKGKSLDDSVALLRNMDEEKITSLNDKEEKSGSIGFSNSSFDDDFMNEAFSID